MCLSGVLIGTETIQKDQLPTHPALKLVRFAFIVVGVGATRLRIAGLQAAVGMARLFVLAPSAFA
jgi:hypothetical protein